VDGGAAGVGADPRDGATGAVGLTGAIGVTAGRGVAPADGNAPEDGGNPGGNWLGGATVDAVGAAAVLGAVTAGGAEPECGVIIRTGMATPMKPRVSAMAPYANTFVLDGLRPLLSRG